MGSIGSIFFTDSRVTNFEQAKTSDLECFSRYYKHMLNHGQYIAPAQFEAVFISAAHREEDIEETLNVIESFLEI